MNFDYLQSFPELKKLHEYCAEAEEFAQSKPSISAAAARKAIEYIVKMIYASLVGEGEPSRTVFEMATDVRFTNYLNDPMLINTIHYIRKMGNVAVHDGALTQEESCKVLEELHFLTGEFCILLGLIEDYPAFAQPQAASPAPPEAAPAPREAVTVEAAVIAKFAPRMRQARFNTAFRRDEAENQRLYLRASLREAGWPIVEQENQPLPGSAGVRMLLDGGDCADYVLYGRDSRPLAVVEYTLTSRNIVAGRKLGLQMAEMLSRKYGYQPVIYYTNGYHIYVIDQLGYPPRRVFQFHSLEELELLQLRAGTRMDITNPQIDDNITDRDYQKKAIRAACQAFSKNRRHSLLVMATGTGKTRISISLVDVLMKAGWVKNVLFLADRTSLVRQAHKNFNHLLPNVTTAMYTGGGGVRDASARIIFATYQTMIKLINDNMREFGSGRFDLIVIDEAHRSIFKKYGVLFQYFDALMLGLTATPRGDENKSTYQVFELQNGRPDYAYELEEAIEDGFLVGFSVLDRTTDTLRRGIYYDELSDEEKEKFEDAFATGDGTTDFKGTVVSVQKTRGRHIINLGTIDAMLGDLMKNGLKVNGGDKLGKTIIFAHSHLEAEKIVERFLILYPYLGLDFCKLIDSQIMNNLGLIDSFSERGQLPQVAVSVDMMDTGIDVPDILNLVFFRGVRSKIKFLQMIGRGTRLSPDVYGPGMDKQGFLIFDYYDNFRYFRTRNTWSVLDETKNGALWSIPSQSILINKRKLSILRELIETGKRTAFEEQYMNELKEDFIQRMRGLCNDDLEVQYHMAFVSKYRTAEHWDGFTDAKEAEIQEHILPLLPPESDPAKVKNFDLMIYVIEDEVPKRAQEAKDIRKIRHGFGNVGKKIDQMMEKLTHLKSIPAVVQKEQLIQQMRNADLLFEDFSLEKCERVRKELRELMQYIPDDVSYYVLDVKDFVIDAGPGGTVAKEKTYAEKALAYIRKGSPALAKLRSLDELTEEEKAELETAFKSTLGTEADYAAWSGNKPLLPFLRLQVGIADEAVETKFGTFLNPKVMNPQQLAYMNQIISYTRENGDITFLDLQRVSPFCDVDIMSLFGQQIAQIKTLINGLHRPVM